MNNGPLVRLNCSTKNVSFFENDILIVFKKKLMKYRKISK